MEEKYRQLLSALEQARKNSESNPCMDTEDELEHSLFWYRVGCTEILEQLLKENPDILKGK